MSKQIQDAFIVAAVRTRRSPSATVPSRAVRALDDLLATVLREVVAKVPASTARDRRRGHPALRKGCPGRSRA